MRTGEAGREEAGRGDGDGGRESRRETLDREQRRAGRMEKRQQRSKAPPGGLQGHANVLMDCVGAAVGAISQLFVHDDHVASSRRDLRR